MLTLLLWIGVTDTAGDATKPVDDTLGDATEGVTDKAGETVEGAEGKVDETAEGALDTADETKEGLPEGVELPEGAEGVTDKVCCTVSMNNQQITNNCRSMEL